MKFKTAAIAAFAALAIPAAGQAEKPADAGKQGAQQKAAHTQTAKTKNVAFVIRGTGLATLPVTDGKLTGPLTLDPTSANRHARKALDLTKTEIRGTDTTSFGVADDAVIVRYVGLTSTDALQPTDKVKVIGKVARTRNPDHTVTYGALDIRKITIKRPEA